MDDDLSRYRIPEAARALQNFVDDMSNWYVRRSRERFWTKGMPQDKINAYMTLYTALVTVAKLAAPMIPFMSESIYRNLVCSLDSSAPESVHLCDYPVADEKWIDQKLEADMDVVLKVVALGRAARNGAGIKNRQPLAKMYVKGEDEVGEYYQKIIEEELNIKSVEFTDDVSSFTCYHFKPQLKTLGPKYGKSLGEIRNALSTLNGNAAKKELDSTGWLKLNLSIGEIKLAPEDLLIEMARSDHYYSVEDGGITVAIETVLTDELVEEGFVREIISKLQTMRKEADFQVMDHIVIYVKGNEKIAGIMQKNLRVIENDTLADALKIEEINGYAKEWDINGERVTLGVEQVK